MDGYGHDRQHYRRGCPDDPEAPTSMLKRKYIQKTIRTVGGGYNDYPELHETNIEVPKEQANCVISKLDDKLPLHAPCLDIDFPCKLYESKTPGHFHLYIDRPVYWDDYKKILKAFADAGIIEEGWYEAAMKDGYTTLDFTVERMPTDRIIADLEMM